jgi:hypothetical protein
MKLNQSINQSIKQKRVSQSSNQWISAVIRSPFSLALIPQSHNVTNDHYYLTQDLKKFILRWHKGLINTMSTNKQLKPDFRLHLTGPRDFCVKSVVLGSATFTNFTVNEVKNTIHHLFIRFIEIMDGEGWSSTIAEGLS